MHNNKNKSLWALCSLILLLPIFSHAAPSIPARLEQIDPARVRKRFQEPRYLPRADRKASVPAAPKPQAFPGAEKIKFTLNKIEIMGGTIYSNQQFRELFAHQLNKRISLADLVEIVKTITLKYRNDGYILSRAVLPPQKIKGGVVKVQIIEGFIDRVLIKGKLPSSTYALLEGYGNHLIASRPLHVSLLERYALLANDIPGMTINTVIAPSKRESGAADLTYVVSRKTYDVHVSYDNRGTRLIGRGQVTVGGYLYGLAPGSSTGLRSIHDDTFQELEYYELSHSEYVGDNGALISLIIDYTGTDPDFPSLAGFTSDLPIKGRSTGIQIESSYPYIRSRRKNLTFSARLKVLDTRSNFSGVPIFLDRIRSLRGIVVFDYLDNNRGLNLFALEVSQGLDALGASASPPSRAFGDLGFTKINVDASRLAAFDKGFSVLISSRGQYGFEHLLSAEEFGFGGSLYGRGYDPSEITGDSGISGKVEIRADKDFSVPAFEQMHAQFFAFADGGIIWNYRIGALGQLPHDDAFSIGGGMRFILNKYINGDIEYGKPLDHIVANEGDKHGRVFLSVTAHA